MTETQYEQHGQRHGQGYRECIVTFLDILGFSELLKSKTAHEMADVLSIFRTISVRGEDATERLAEFAATRAETRVEIVSDAIVRVRPNKIDPLTKMSEIFDELIILKEILTACLDRGIVIRGAMTIGPMYLDDDPVGPVFGPALVDAYQLESREVIYPRIAISGEVLARHRGSVDPLLAESHDVDLEMSGLILSRDGAGLYFIDYIRAIMEDLNWGAEEVASFLSNHRQVIRTGLDKHRGSIRRKYLWLQNYHNSSIDDAIARGRGSVDDPESDVLSIQDWKFLRVDARKGNAGEASVFPGRL